MGDAQQRAECACPLVVSLEAVAEHRVFGRPHLQRDAVEPTAGDVTGLAAFDHHEVDEEGRARGQGAPRECPQVLKPQLELARRSG